MEESRLHEVLIYDALGNCVFNMVVNMTAAQADLHGQKLHKFFDATSYDTNCIEAPEAYIKEGETVR